MSYLVVVTFDIEDGESTEYSSLYDGLKKLGLERTIKDISGNILQLPTTTVAGKLEGESAAKLRDSIRASCVQLYDRLHITGKIFVSVGGKWAWGGR